MALILIASGGRDDRQLWLWRAQRGVIRRAVLRAVGARGDVISRATGDDIRRPCTWPHRLWNSWRLAACGECKRGTNGDKKTDAHDDTSGVTNLPDAAHG